MKGGMRADGARGAPPARGRPYDPVLTESRRFHISGVVQGVGFRPFIHRLAIRHGLAGSVRNESGEVFIEVEGSAESLDRFGESIRLEAPPLARIESCEWEPITTAGRSGFEVLDSRATPTGRLPVSPDVSICDACRSELLDPTDRRFAYPFITCTDCGPRYTVIEAMPYDRERTSMRVFPQCAACRSEYEDPDDRRFHSETNSCHECGPTVRLLDPDGPSFEPGLDATMSPAEAISGAARLLREGAIVAVRGLGGFHLAVDARSETAVARLRQRKGRWEKPLAVMAFDLESARRIAALGSKEESLLTSRERPILLGRARSDSGLAPSVSPGLDTVGLMLAYTPLHLLLLRETGGPLVMTSGNASELPIATANEEALLSLSGIADAFLVHDREIVSRYDDSVVRVIGGVPAFLRRARGYAPLPVTLPLVAAEPVLAVGPHLKNTFALVAGETAFVSQHIGDLENLETLEHFHASLRRFRELFRIEPRVIACDAHPGYLSTRVAEELAVELGESGSAGLPIVRVQHHHAHIAAVAAEHGITEPIVGVAYDGTGYGTDGHSWGAEILVADLRDFRRVARLSYAPMPGGDLAARRPWRAALGYRTLIRGEDEAFAEAFADIPEAELQLVDRQARRGVNSPLASSMGRLFDAAAAVLGLRAVATFEGQAAMELESLGASGLGYGSEPGPDLGRAIRKRAARAGVPTLPFPQREGDDLDPTLLVMDPGPLLVGLGRSFANGAAPELLAAAFHLAVADRTVETVWRVAEEEGLGIVALGGGTFQNALLTPLIRDGLRDRGLRVLVPETLGPNDGSISYGQAAVAVSSDHAKGR
ncbi:MAG: carbamoyltransferase HypF [marine benthic group bacterium]|nr:carbamoyltransferase HypF [Gemmatimonadota bacterium]